MFAIIAETHQLAIFYIALNNPKIWIITLQPLSINRGLSLIL
jgi:hypothetical protein